MAPGRRDFLKTSTTAITAAGLSGCDAGGGAGNERTMLRRLDRALLRAIGDAVLPDSIGAAGRDRAIVAFEIWLQEFEPNAELVHPYGGWIVPYGPDDPSPRWAEQLEQLEHRTRDRSMSSFRDLSREDRRALLTEAIEDEGPDFPAPADAQHIAVALMAHYFASSDATNQCYGAAIDKLQCRVVATAGEKPIALDRTSSA
jgi:hypothetical protein